MKNGRIIYLSAIMALALSCLACETFPISVGNLTTCVDRKCTYLQHATATQNLVTGSSSCFEFQSVNPETTGHRLQVDTNHALASHALTDCYWTDDPAFDAKGVCHCPGSPLTNFNCPCSAGPPAFNDHKFCITARTTGRGCIVSHSNSGGFCMTIGVSILERYRVCRISGVPKYDASITIQDNFDNYTHSVHLEPSVTTFNDPSGDFSMSIEIISLNADQVKDFVVTDLHTGDSYFLNNDLINGLNEFSPGKLGYCKRVGSVVTCSPEMKDRVMVSVLNCAQDKFSIDYQYPTFQQILSGADKLYHTSTGTNIELQGLGPVPPLQRGAIFGTSNGMAWLGLTTQGYLSIGPYSFLIPFSQVPNIAGTPATFSGSVHPLPRNASCTYHVLVVEDDSNDHDHGYLACPFWPHGNYILGRVDGNTFYTGTNAAIEARFYPNMVELSRTFAVIASTVVVATDQREAILADVVLDVPVREGSTAIMSIAYKDYSIEFDSTTIVPRITNLIVHDREVILSVRSDQSSGNCYISTSPFITSTTPAYLTTSELEVTMGILAVNYSGDATLTVACGVRHVNRTFHVDIHQGIYDFTQHTIVQSLNPFHHDGFFVQAPWRHILLRVVIYSAIAFGGIISLYGLWKVITPKIMTKVLYKGVEPPRLNMKKYY